MSEHLLDRRYAEAIYPRFLELRSQARSVGTQWPLVARSLVELEFAIEELRVAEEELRGNQQALADAWHAAETGSGWNRSLFDGAAAPMLVTTLDGRIRDANPAASALLGVPPEHLRGKPLSVFLPAGERRMFSRTLTQIASLPHEPVELCLVPRYAEPVWAEARIRPFTPDDGTAGLHWTLHDVTGRRTAERVSSAPAETLRLSLQALPSAVLVLDVDGTVIHWNPAASPCFDEFTERVIRSAAQGAGGGTATIPLPARTKDGEPLQLDASLSRLVGGDGVSHGTLVHLAPARAAEPEAEEDEAEDSPAAKGRLRDEAPPAGGIAWTDEEARRVLISARAGGDLVERLRDGISAGLYLGHLRPGDRLPSIREVARLTHHDHRYVSAAYRRLAAEGVVEIRTRHGVVVGPVAPALDPPSNETAAWLADVIGQAADMRVKVPNLPELVKAWTAAAPVRCLCLDGTEDGLVALSTELGAQWGFETRRLLLGDSPRRDELLAALRDADVVVTTPFHASVVAPTARDTGVPLVVLEANPEMVEAAEERLREAGSLTAVVADARHGERLRCLAGGEGLRVVLADDAAAVAGLDPAEPVLLTRAAQQRVQKPMRLLAPVAPAFSSARAKDLAAVLIRRNLNAIRATN